MSKVALTKENGEGQDERSRKSKMKRRTDGWEAAKAEIAKELGLWDKVQASGWASLTAAEAAGWAGCSPGVFPARPRKMNQKTVKSCKIAGNRLLKQNNLLEESLALSPDYDNFCSGKGL